MGLVDMKRYGPTWVYQLCCEHGGLLYVGIAVDLDRRLAQHRKTKAWWSEVAHVVAHQFPTRDDARLAELDAINLRQPIYNIEGVRPNDQFAADAWAQRHQTWELPIVSREVR